MNAGARRNVGAAVLWGALTAFYAILGLAVLTPDAVYSGDIGVKFVQARALAQQRFASMEIPYPGQFLDPARELFPIRAPFVMTSAGVTQAIFPPASTTVQAVAVSLAGLRGFILVSLIAGAIVLYAVWGLSPRRYAGGSLLAAGLGGPLWFYAVSGWEHAPAIAFSTAAFACAVCWPARASTWIAGMLLGAGATLRDEVLVLLPGLLFTTWLQTRRPPALAAVVLGALIPLACAAALEVGWFHRPPAAHLRHAVHLVQSAVGVANEPNPDVPVLRPMTLRERYETVVQYWLLGYGRDSVIALFFSGFVLAVAWRLLRGSSVIILMWFIAVIALAAIDLRELISAPKWLAGLHRVSPYLVFACLPIPRGSTRYPWLGVPVVVTTAAYLLIAFAGVDTTGGKSLGPRLLLPLWPLLVVAAITAIGEYFRAPSGVDRWVGRAGVVLVAMTIVMQIFGTIPAYYWRNRDDASAIVAVRASPERIVIADDPFTAQLLFPLYYRKVLFLADSPSLGSRAGSLLNQYQVGGALLVSRNPSPVITLQPYRLERTEPHGRMVVQYWRR